MIILSIASVLLIPTIFGFLLLSLLLQQKNAHFLVLEKLSQSFALGLGAIALIMYGLGIVGFRIDLINICICIIVLSVPILTYCLKNQCLAIKSAELKFSWPDLGVWGNLLLGLISLKVIFVFFSGLIKPLIDCDAFQFYSIVAKGLFYDKSFTLAYLQQFIGDKPLLPFLAQGWTFIGMGMVNDAYLKLIPAVLFLCLLIIFYSVLRRSLDRNYALLFTWLLSTLPFLVYHATTAYADLTITFFYSVGTFYLFLFMQEYSKKKQFNPSYLFLTACFLGLTVWAKKAGLVLAGIELIMLSIFLFINKAKLNKDHLKQIVIAGTIFVLLVTPWLAMGRLGSLTNVVRSMAKAGQIDQAAPTNAGDEGKIGVMLEVFSKKLFLYGDWMLLWPMLIITMLFFYKRSFSPPYVLLLAIIFLDVLSLFVQFGSGETFRWLLDGTLLDRLAMNSTPVVLLFSAQVIASFLGPKGNSSES